MQANNKKQIPTLIEEMALYQQGYSSIAGLDEAPYTSAWLEIELCEAVLRSDWDLISTPNDALT